MPYPDSEYPSILRGKDKRESQRLMAAAPELLSIAEHLLEWASEDDPLAGDPAEYLTFLGAAAGRAIAKAEGRE